MIDILWIHRDFNVVTMGRVPRVWQKAIGTAIWKNWHFWMKFDSITGRFSAKIAFPNINSLIIKFPSKCGFLMSTFSSCSTDHFMSFFSSLVLDINTPNFECQRCDKKWGMPFRHNNFKIQ
ncbi:MAG: hypothetical protein Ta2E_12190 [Mycoplasmoidaceae bacterium]|nr:MAG: hypothetical protein Ta2E_12190 [Mycoplasmoidaceae bacterium]